MNPFARTSPRVQLAATLRRIAGANGGGGGLSMRVPVAFPQVSLARPDLERLADRLADGEPVDPRGVALAHDLVTDGTGPLYWSASREDLGARVRHALLALDGGMA